MNDRRRIHWRLVATLCCIAGVVLVWLEQSERVAAQAPRLATNDPAVAPPQTIDPSSWRWVGTASCAAASCHGRTAPAGSVGAEYTTFITRDPHAKAYEVLFDERSVRMASLLRESMHGKPAHESPLCLNCHAPGPADFKPQAKNFDRSFGVGCEECHGLASEWLNPHTTAAWQRRGWQGDDERYKFRLGMTNTKDIGWRALTCAECHVGMPTYDGDNEVNHDMIAAGHPRLVFEFSSFHDRLPKHWRERRTAADPRPRDRDLYPDWDARAWLVGQLYSALWAINLLEEHASDIKVNPDLPERWPELSDFECGACHQPIQPTAPNLSGSPTRTLVPAEWYTVLLPVALNIAKTDEETVKEIGRLSITLADNKASRSAISTDATRLYFALGEAEHQLTHDPVSGTERTPTLLNVAELRRWTRDLADSTADKSDLSWDRAAQTAFAIQAFQRTLSQMQPRPSDAKVTQLAGRLVETVWPSDANGRRVDSYSAAKAFSPARFAERLRELRDAMP